MWWALNLSRRGEQGNRITWGEFVCKYSQLTPSCRFWSIDELARLWDSPQLHAKNQEFTTELGTEGEAEGEIGMGVDIGIEASGDLVGYVQYEHTLLQQGDGESSTTITVELGDCKHPWIIWGCGDIFTHNSNFNPISWGWRWGRRTNLFVVWSMLSWTRTNVLRYSPS